MKAMVLCAGYGTRMGNLTQEIPKPMLALHGRPLLTWLLSHLREQGFHDVALNLHFLPGIIQQAFGDGSPWGLRLTYSHEESLLGTAGGLKRVADYFRAEELFLVHYGDILTDQDFSAMIRFHRARHALATLLVHQRPDSNSAASLDPEGRITAFLERPGPELRPTVKSPWVNSGICVCSPEIFEWIPAGASDLPRDVFPALVSTGRLYGFPLAGYRCAIDSPVRLLEGSAALAEGRCRIQPLNPQDYN